MGRDRANTAYNRSWRVCRNQRDDVSPLSSLSSPTWTGERIDKRQGPSDGGRDIQDRLERAHRWGFTSAAPAVGSRAAPKRFVPSVAIRFISVFTPLPAPYDRRPLSLC